MRLGSRLGLRLTISSLQTRRGRRQQGAALDRLVAAFKLAKVMRG
jgi:hypothetical protein